MARLYRLRLYRILVGCLLFLFATLVQAETVRLHLPILVETPKQHEYFHELLRLSLIKSGHQPDFVVAKYPQLRIKKYLEAGFISLFWMVESEERNRNQKYIPIPVGLTNGLIGNRILFIKQGTQHKFDQVKTLADFRALGLKGGMGHKWFDAKVWEANDLAYQEFSGNWRAIFQMVAMGRTFDYFSRGLVEIMEEAKQYPDLAIEQNLVLVYDRDFKFYLSKSGSNAGAQYQSIISEAIQQARAHGLIETLVRKYWKQDFKTLNYDARRKLQLHTPK